MSPEEKVASPEKVATPTHISINKEDIEGHDCDDTPKSAGTPRSSSGWDGKLRLDKVEKKLALVNPEAISDPEYSDEENVLPGEVIAADEGKAPSSTTLSSTSTPILEPDDSYIRILWKLY